MIYSKPQITKSLRKLCEGEMIEKQKTVRGAIITISNYDFYQNSGNCRRNDEGSTKETRGKEKDSRINNNDKQCKNGKNPSEPKKEGVIYLFSIIET